MANLISAAPRYSVKILAIDGTVPSGTDTHTGTTVTMPEPLPIAGATFTQGMYTQGQKQLGSFTLTLCNVRAAEYRYLIPYYQLINYEMRVEIYDNEDLAGDPLFAGVVTKIPQDFGRWEIQGESVLRKLEERRLRRYQVFNSTSPYLTNWQETVAEIIDDLLNTYINVFKDDFNIANTSVGTVDADWSITGDVRVLNEQVQFNSGALTSVIYDMQTVTTFSADKWDTAKLSFDFYEQQVTAGLQGSQLTVFLNGQTGAGTQEYKVQITPSDVGFNADGSIILYDLSANNLGQRVVTRLDGQWNHVDIYNTRNSSTARRNIVICINNVEMLNIVVTGAASKTGKVEFTWRIQGMADSPLIDNVVLFQQFNQLTAGTIDSPTVTPSDFQFNGDTYLDALDRLCDLESWEYTIQYKQNAGNDIITIGSAVGTDRSATIVYCEEASLPDSQTAAGDLVITNLTKERANNQLATVLNAYGQAQDDVSANFIAMDLAQMDTYGLIEADYPDQRILDSNTARTLAQWRLEQVAYGSVSLQGDVLSEEYYLSGAYLIPGDYVWLKAPLFGVDKKVKVVQLTRTSGSKVINLVFDYLGYELDKQVDNQLKLLAREYRSFDDRMNVMHWPMNFGAAGTQTVYPYLRGNQIKKSWCRVSTLAAGAGTVKLIVDGYLVIANLLTPPFTVDALWLLTTPGEHSIAVQASAAMTFDMFLWTQSLA